MTVHTTLAVQVPYWVAVLTPEERPFGNRRTDPRIDITDDCVVTTTQSQWVGPERPSENTLLAVLAATVGAWQGARCRSSASGALIDIRAEDGSEYPVRVPTTGPITTDCAALTDEVRRRASAAPSGGCDYAEARDHPALSRRSGAQIAFRYGNDQTVSDSEDPLHHSLSVTCAVTEADGVTMVNTSFRWNSRIFSAADVDDFERFWEKTLGVFV